MSSADLELFKDFIDGKINPKSAAILLTKDIDMTISGSFTESSIRYEEGLAFEAWDGPEKGF